jgi:hypothetical protein
MKTRYLLAWLSVVALALSLPAAETKLKAGVATIDVTPEKFPVRVNCYFNERIATAAADRLHARALVLDDGTTRILLCVVDSCMMPREFLDKVKELAAKPSGIPVENMMISATHTHSAPAVMGCLGCDADEVYPKFLESQLVRAITMAAKNLVPAKAGWAVTHAPKHTYNRRWILRSDKVRNDPFGNPTVRANMHPGYQHPDFIGPSGPVDDSLSLLALRTHDDKPLAVLANFSMHYFGSPALSSDYFGLFCAGLAKRIDAEKPPWVAMSQGTSGDLMWMDYGSPEKKITIQEYTDGLMQIAHDAYKKIEYKTDVPLKMKETKLTLNRRVPDAKRLEWAHKVMAGVKNGKVQSQQEIYAREALMLHAEPKRELKLQAIMIGKGGIYAIPNEVFALTGLLLKGSSGFEPAFVVELANGAEGYIPSQAQHALGGYTTWPARTAALTIDAESKISDTLSDMGLSLSGRGFGDDLEHRTAFLRALKSNPAVRTSFEEFGRDDAWVLAMKKQFVGGTYEDGVAYYLPGKFGRCVHFAGGRMKANVKDLGPTYSVEFWFWNGFPNNVRDVTGYMFSRGEDGAKDAPGDHLGIGGTHAHAGKLIFFNGNAKNQIVAGKTDLKLKEWYHVVLIRDGKNVTAYLNGKEEFSGEADVTVPEKCTQIFFGGRNDKFRGFEGKLDEAAIYNRALTAKEIAEHFAAAGK